MASLRHIWSGKASLTHLPDKKDIFYNSDFNYASFAILAMFFLLYRALCTWCNIDFSKSFNLSAFISIISGKLSTTILPNLVRSFTLGMPIPGRRFQFLSSPKSLRHFIFIKGRPSNIYFQHRIEIFTPGFVPLCKGFEKPFA